MTDVNVGWSIDTESIYQKVLVTFGRVGLKHNINLVYSYHDQGGFIAIPENDSRAGNIDRSYDVIGTYSSRPLPRLDLIDGDVHEYLDEERAKPTGIRPELFKFIKAG
jgi:hypothetical protein